MVSNQSIFAGDSRTNEIIEFIESNHPGLSRVSLDNNQLTPQQSERLCTALAKNTFLEHINLFGTVFNLTQLQMLKRAIISNEQIKELILEDAGACSESGCQEIIGEIREMVKERKDSQFSL